MQRYEAHHYSQVLEREMHMLVYGHDGIPFLVFPTQDSLCWNYEEFGMIDVLADYIECGRIQLFCIDTIDKESWSDAYGDKGHRSYMQEQYYYYVTNEVVPMIYDTNPTGQKIITTGCSLGATHAVILPLRRPDLFGGCLALSGCYDATEFWDGWCDERLYNNSPCHFIPNMPENHPYIQMYNEMKLIICVGQGPWEDQGIETTRRLKEAFDAKGIHAWVDFWGYDVNHDWPWWKKQYRYFLPYILGDQ